MPSTPLIITCYPNDVRPKLKKRAREQLVMSAVEKQMSSQNELQMTVGFDQTSHGLNPPTSLTEGLTGLDYFLESLTFNTGFSTWFVLVKPFTSEAENKKKSCEVKIGGAPKQMLPSSKMEGAPPESSRRRTAKPSHAKRIAPSFCSLLIQ